MKENKIIEGNRLIAEFMGLEKTDGFMTSCSGIEVSAKGYKCDDVFYPINELKFYYLWNWLMPVVEKVESMGYIVTITQNICTIKASVMVITRQTGNYGTPDTKIYNTWLALIDFIKWYKENTE